MPSDRDFSSHAAATMVADPALRTGRLVFQRYRLQRLLGRGGMGVVWLAIDEKLERPVALKFLPDVLFLDPAARDDLKRETRRSLDLTHPHIVRIHDFIEDDETAAIAMEYVDGSNLSQLRVDRPSRVFETSDLEVWTAALCAALDYAHDVGRCVHRDLKPSNLMVSARGVLKVADFGISCGLHHTAARVSTWSSTGGTLGYMSPQQLLGELASPADDIYSVGATLYELLTGKPPFFGGDISAQIREVQPDSIAVRRGRFGLPGAAVPPAWEEVIAACLAKRAEDRPRNLREVGRRLGLPMAAAAEIATALGQELAPTMREPAARVAPRFSVPSMPAWAKEVGGWMAKFRWPILTAVAALAAVLPWLRSSPPTADTVVPLDSQAAQIAVVSPPAKSAPTIAPVAELSGAVAPAAVVSTSQIAPAEPSADSAFLRAEIPVSQPPAPEPPPQIEIVSNPPGVPFQIFASAYETPNPQVLFSGETPATVAQLAPGVYRVSFAVPGLPPRSAIVEIPEHGTAHVQQEFPSGVLKISSQPAGAEIICDGKSLGPAPVEATMLIGKHEIGARWQGRDARVRAVTLKTDEKEAVAFDFRVSSDPRPRSRRTKPKEEDNLWEKMGRSINKIFTGDKSKKGK